MINLRADGIGNEIKTKTILDLNLQRHLLLQFQMDDFYKDPNQGGKVVQLVTFKNLWVKWDGTFPGV